MSRKRTGRNAASDRAVIQAVPTPAPREPVDEGSAQEGAARDRKTPLPTVRKLRHRLVLQQAPVEPLDVDGVRTITVGTVLWAIAFVGLLPFADRLGEADARWWLWTCATGVVLGLLGIAYCVHRRSRLRRSNPQPAGNR